MRIVFDFDGVICSSQEEMIARLNEKTGKNYTINDWKYYSYKESFGDDAEKMASTFEEEIYIGSNCKEYPGAINAIHYAKEKGHDVSIVSECANEEVFNRKVKFCKLHGLNDIKIYGVYTGNKAELNCDMLVEDCVETLIESKAQYKILVTKPWNKEVDVTDKQIHRVDTDDELFEAIRQLVK